MRAATAAGSQAAPDTLKGEPRAAERAATAALASSPASTSVPVSSGAGEYFQRHFGDDAERAVTAGQQLAQVEPRDVLQHPAAGMEDLSRAIHGADTHHVVAHGAPRNAARARQVGGHDAADGLAGAAQQAGEIRRLGDEMLALFG